MNSTFWNDKNVLITGHTGFKGGWLSLWLKLYGANITGYSLDPPSDPNLFTSAHINDSTTSIHGDIRDADKLISVFRKVKPDIVFHLAAQPIVRLSYSDPLETYSTNVMGTANLLEAARQTNSVRSVICVTSDKCYQNNNWHWGYRETDPMGGHDPYSSSKGCSELVAASYRSSFFNPDNYEEHNVGIATVRAGNVIGGGDWARDRLVTDIVTAFLNNKEVKIRSPHAIRPWQYVLEPLRGYIMLAEKLYDSGADYSQAWNFGPDSRDAKPVKYIAERMAGLWGDNASWDQDNNKNHPHEAHYLKVDSSKAHNKLNWYPTFNLDTSLKWVVDWYKEFAAKDSMRDYTENQIIEYNKLSHSTNDVQIQNAD